MRRVEGVGSQLSTYRDTLILFVLRNSSRGVSRRLCISFQFAL